MRKTLWEFVEDVTVTSNNVEFGEINIEKDFYSVRDG